MDETRSYDLVVIGSGPAGEKGAAQAAYFGKKVAMVEARPHLGGAAANTGTLPSKTLRETSLMLSGLRSRQLLGVDLSLRREASVTDFLYHEENVADAERMRITSNMDRHRVELIQGFGRFIDPHTVEVLDESDRVKARLRGEVILIATGSSPRHADPFPHEHSSVYDSDSILRLGKMPQSLTVVGGGVIGSEYACTFAALGIPVTLIHGRDTLLDFLDQEVTTALREAMTALGIEVIAPDKVVACQVHDDGATMTLESGRLIASDAVLVAVGRTSNTAALHLDRAGITRGKYGLIEVDEQFRTNVPHIYAAGDVIGFPALASTSMEQARLAMVHAFDLKYKTEFAPILPYGIYTIPEVSMVGKTEQDLAKEGVPYVVGKATYCENARGRIIGDSAGFLKLIFHRDDMKLLGVHIIGEIASELAHIGLSAIMVGAGADLFIRTCFNYPTLGEMYKYATYDAMGRREQIND